MEQSEYLYDFEIDQVIAAIQEAGAQKVLLQFPDGLKLRSREVIDAIKARTTAQPIVWLGACFGACDIPITASAMADMVIQFGHNKFNKKVDGWK